MSTKCLIKFGLNMMVVSLMIFVTPVTANDLAKLLANTQSIQARFVQIETDLESFDEKISYGKLYTQSPNLMRWENDDDMVVMVANGQQFSILDRDLDQVNIYPQDQVMQATPAILLSQPQQFDENFVLKVIRSAEAGDWYDLQPRLKNNLYDYLEVLVGDGRVKELVIGNRLQNSSIQLVLYYSQASVNKALDPSLFELEIPSGADIIDHSSD